ncbi:MAG: CPBP family intramembrane metalloprotease [Acidobacteria bacterium]|nr:CPBP family intramembrane metalloprotease [Acidobacteriota bacterium]
MSDWQEPPEADLEPQPEPGRVVPPRDPFFPPPWGGLLTGLGLALTVFLLLVSAVVLAVFAQATTLSLESVGFRYVALVLSQLVLVVVPLGFALRLSGRLETLGVRRFRGAALLEGVLLGGGLVLATGAYGLLLSWISPEAYGEMMAEQQLQMELLQAPLPLLVLAALVLAPLTEEVFFRAFLFGGLRSSLNFAVASGISAAIFAGIHMMPLSTPALFLVGLATAASYERHRSLAAPLAVHIAFNGISLLAELVT